MASQKLVPIVIAVSSAVLLSSCVINNPKALTRQDTSHVRFRPVVNKTSVQCTEDTLEGSWARSFTKENSYLGKAVWTFTKTGHIYCVGGACEGKHGVPRGYSVGPIRLGKPSENLGLHIRFKEGVMKINCEIDQRKLYFGNGNLEQGLTFLRL